MKYSPILLFSAALLRSTNAINMTYYTKGVGIPDGFEEFFKTYFVVIEDPTALTAYEAYFADDAHLKILNPPIYDIVGPTNIGKLASQAQANLTWNHYPNTTSVITDGTDTQLIQIDGKLETTWKNYDDKCSTSYITWRWNLTKVDGAIDLKPQNKQVKVFWDYIVTPYSPKSPTNIPCTG